MEIDVENKLMIYIDSNQRVPGGSPQDFFIQYTLPPDHRYNAMVCAQAAIPKSYYMTITSYNTFELSEDGGNTYTTITMPLGNYNVSSFITTLQTLLGQASIILGNGNTYTITYPNVTTSVDTGKLTFITTNTPNQSAFRFIDQYGINIQMGFAIDELDPALKTVYHFVGTTLISTGVINLQPAKSVYITCDQCNDGISNIFQAVQNQAVGTMNICAYQMTTPLEVWAKPFNGSTDNIFHFALVDEFLQPIQMNGQEWSMQILLFRRTSFYDKIINFIKFMTTIFAK